MADQTDPTLTSDFDSAFLPPDQSAPIFEAAARVSVAQRLFPQVPLGPNGKIIPVVTGRASAAWIDEGEAKPATTTSLALRNMAPKKIAAISVVSAETVRANPGNFMQVLRKQLGEAFGIAFDAAVLYGEGPFPTWVDQTTKQVELGSNTPADGGAWQDLVSAIRLVVTDTTPITGSTDPTRRQVNGFVFDDMAEPDLLGSVDASGRPILVNLETSEGTSSLTTVRSGRLMGRSMAMTSWVAADDFHAVGFAGDFTKGVWGVTSGITYRVSTEATVEVNGSQVNLWQKNLVAILAEAEYGFYLEDPLSFVKIANLIGS